MSKAFGMTVIGVVGLTAIMSPSAQAIDLGASVSVGGVSAGAGASVGSGGASAGASVSAGDTQGSASGSVSTDGGGSVQGGAALSNGEESAAASFSVGGGGVDAGLGVQPNTADPQQPGPGAPPPTPGAPPPTPVASADPAGSTMALPVALTLQYPCDAGAAERCEVSSPDDDSLDPVTPEYLRAVAALALQPTAPLATVMACRNGIIQGAMPFEPVRVDAVSAGGIRPLEDGGHVAPLVVRIVYDRQGGYEVREAPIECTVDAGGAVVSLAG